MADPFAPEGALAQKLPNYEHRPQQSIMARRVADTLQKGGVALIEAGTGTGKSLAYLIPAARAALASERPSSFDPYHQFAGTTDPQRHSARPPSRNAGVKSRVGKGMEQLFMPTAL